MALRLRRIGRLVDIDRVCDDRRIRTTGRSLRHRTGVDRNLPGPTRDDNPASPHVDDERADDGADHIDDDQHHVVDDDQHDRARSARRV